MRRCERRCEEEQMWEKMWRWADVREDVKMSRCERWCEDEQMWRWADVKMSRCGEKIWRWTDVKMSRCERRCEDDQMWRWADVKMSRCEDEQMWEKIWRWEDVKMRRCEDEKVWRWEDVKMRRCDRRCEDEKVWRWEDVKMRRWDTDPHYWKNPALRRSREKRIFQALVLALLPARIHKYDKNMIRTQLAIQTSPSWHDYHNTTWKHMIMNAILRTIPVVPHKAAAEVSKIGNL